MNFRYSGIPQQFVKTVESLRDGKREWKLREKTAIQEEVWE